MSLTRRQFCLSSVALAATSAASLLTPNTSFAQANKSAKNPWITKDGKIKIGLLWSLTGALSVIEKPSRDVALFWIDQVNQNGGIAGMEVVPVEVDAKSDMGPYRAGTKKLIDDEHVLAIFGGYTSVSRRAIMPLITLRNHLLYYPTCYESHECWQNIICTGPIANQHGADLIPYMVKKHGPRVYFIGSNYTWPKESNRMASHLLNKVNGQLLAESYMPLGLGHFSEIIKDIKQKQPDWIFSTLVGDSDVFFRQQYMAAGFTPDKLPTASLTTSEVEVRAMGYEFGEDHYTATNYFQSMDNPTNHRFVDDFLASRHGISGVTHANMESTYLSFLLFKKAVENIVLTEGVMALSPENLRHASNGMALSDQESPQGYIRLDSNNYNLWQKMRIGRFNAAGQADILYTSNDLLQPKPFILYPDRGICRADGLHLPNGKIIKAAS